MEIAHTAHPPPRPPPPAPAPCSPYRGQACRSPASHPPATAHSRSAPGPCPLHDVPCRRSASTHTSGRSAATASAAPAANAAVTPGTTSNSTPAARSAAISSPRAPKHQRITRLLTAPRSVPRAPTQSSAHGSPLRNPRPPAPLAHTRHQRMTMRQRQHLLRHQVVMEHHSAVSAAAARAPSAAPDHPAPHPPDKPCLAPLAVIITLFFGVPL